MVNVERVRQAVARLWPADADHVVLQHDQTVRFVVPGLTTNGRVKRFSLKRALRSLLVSVAMGLLWRLAVPGWLMPFLLLEYQPTMVRAAGPDGESVRLARALIPVRTEGLIRRLNAYYAQLWLLDGSSALIAIRAADARVLP